MQNILGLVKMLNAVIHSHKHPMYGTDERIATVHFDNTDTITEFNSDEVNTIYGGVLAVAKEYELTEFGRIKIEEVFDKCWINESGNVEWKIWKNGRNVMSIEFNTERHSLGNNKIYTDRYLMVASPILHPNTDYVAKNAGGDMFILKSDMNSFRNIVSYMMSVTRETFDYNQLALLMSDNAVLRITHAPNMPPAPSIEYTFYSSFTVVETIRPPFSFVSSMYNKDFLDETAEIITEWLNEEESF